MNKLPLIFEPPSLEAITSIKHSGEVVTDGLFYLHAFDPSQLKLVIFIGNYLVQYEVDFILFRIILETKSEKLLNLILI
jgi:hypothetical protein